MACCPQCAGSGGTSGNGEPVAVSGSGSGSISSALKLCGISRFSWLLIAIAVVVIFFWDGN